MKKNFLNNKKMKKKIIMLAMLGVTFTSLLTINSCKPEETEEPEKGDAVLSGEITDVVQ